MEQLIIRNIDDWIAFFEGLNNLKEQTYNVVSKGIISLQALKDNNLVSFNEVGELFNLLVKIKIRNFDEAIKLLESLESFYSYQKPLKEIKELKEKYGITHLAFQTKDKVIVSEYYTSNKFIKVYNLDNCIVEKNFDLTTNGLTQVILNGHRAYIIEQRMLDEPTSDFNKRIICTRDFRLNINLLPQKEEMDIYKIKQERKLLFANLLYYLSCSSKKVTLIIDNPNQEYLQDEEIRKDYFTISSDGKLRGDHQDLEPRSSRYLNVSKIEVSDANFVVISKVLERDIQKIYLIVKQDFLEEFKKDCSEYLIKILDLFVSEDIKVRSLMLD